MTRAMIVRLVACAAVSIGTVGTAALGADAPPPSNHPGHADASSHRDGPADGEPPADGATREEVRRRLRDGMARRAAETREDLAALERVIALMDEGKTIEQIRQELGDGARRRLVAEFLMRPDRRGDRPDRPDRGDRQGGSRGQRGAGPDADLMGEAPGEGPGRASRGEGPRDRSQVPAELTDADKQTIRDFIAATAPAMARQFTELEQRDSEAAAKKMRDIAPRMQGLLELRSRDPKLYDLKLIDIREGREAIEAVRELAKLEREGAAASDARRQAASARLKAALEKQYDARSEAMSHDAVRLKERIDGRPARKAQAIEETTRRMLEREKNRAERDGPDGEDGPKGHRHPGDRQD